MLAEIADPKATDTISAIIFTVLSFIMAISFLVGIFSDNVKPIKLTDKFDLGYIEDKPVAQNYSQVTVAEEYDELKDLKRKVEIEKLKKQLRELQKPVFDDDLFRDCVDALTGLGTSPRKAKAETQVLFEKNPNIKTVQEFIREYGKRCA